VTITRIKTCSGFWVSLTLTGVLAIPPAHSQEWPSKSIRWIVTALPGTVNDSRARLVGEAVSEILKQPIVVDNKAGAAGNIGAQLAARAPADGYTWLYSASPMATNMRMYKSPGFDVIRDFVHITRLGTSDVLLVVHAESPVNSVSELVALAKVSRGKLSYGSGGVGTPAHMAAELLLASAGAEAVHVPYKGAVQAMVALLGREIDFTLPIFSVAFPHVQLGKLRALAVAGASRNPKLAEIPTLAEAGVPGVVVTGFGGVSVPAGTPAPIVARIYRTVHQAMERPAVRAKIEAEGGMITVNSPAEYTQNFRDEILLTERAMKVAKLEPQ